MLPFSATIIFIRHAATMLFSIFYRLFTPLPPSLFAAMMLSPHTRVSLLMLIADIAIAADYVTPPLRC